MTSSVGLRTTGFKAFGITSAAVLIFQNQKSPYLEKRAELEIDIRMFCLYFCIVLILLKLSVFVLRLLSSQCLLCFPLVAVCLPLSVSVFSSVPPPSLPHLASSLLSLLTCSSSSHQCVSVFKSLFPPRSLSVHCFCLVFLLMCDVLPDFLLSPLVCVSLI